MRSRRDAIALAALLASLLVISILVRSYAGEAEDGDTRLTTYRSTSHGVRALYLLLEELRFAPQRLLQPWTPGWLERADGVLVVLSPVEQPTPREVATLRGWIEGGGALIHGSRARDALLEELELVPYSLAGAGVVRGADAERGVASFPRQHEWAAGIDSVVGFRQAFDRSRLPPGTEVILATADDRPTVITFPVGEGRVVAWSDPDVLSNRVLRDGGAATLFVRAAAALDAGDGVVLFDEYHLGYRDGSPLQALRGFLRTPAGRVLLQGAAALVLVLLLFGRRFGAAVPEPAAMRRSPLEHVEAVAAAYSKAGAHGAARRLLLAGAERRVGRRLQQEDGSLSSLDGSAAGRRLREEWERGSAGEPGRLAALAGAVDDYVAEVRRWK